MAPVVPTIHVSELATEINALPHGKTRSPPIDLASLPLKELVQYRCDIVAGEKGTGPIVKCVPVVRLYRQCDDGRLIETTSWESWKKKQRTAEVSATEAS
ncbi:hypothetical protein BU24DRAFT_416085 [Aaosphaeria arxii CBS 175.79]|uniref:Uncharacterized protein n=1 Tax=Aaosphaeria arxii CBS 175.79 TaxID=1450172 RepID=A0A6A5Y528_9PLEO|nr:uncharacterized protein BU24DRAFT_416085 [Aaosphaeria arxii CBS 175.79]KAF2020379.1 hypothetical protein BU24DRAFT_416085 [Aaosphaeria arxii CBS 175.79]